MNYSQNDEQEVICRVFGGFVGRFLDIGAFDGLSISNTRKLLELGWSGTLIEPSPRNVVKLQANCAQFGNRATIVAAAVSNIDLRLVPLREDQNPEKLWNVSIDQSAESVLMVSCLPPRVFPGPWDFINIDTEGEDMEILKSAPYDWWEAQLICAEPGGSRPDMRAFLETKGYTLCHETKENILMRKSAGV